MKRSCIISGINLIPCSIALLCIPVWLLKWLSHRTSNARIFFLYCNSLTMSIYRSFCNAQELYLHFSLHNTRNYQNVRSLYHRLYNYPTRARGEIILRTVTTCTFFVDTVLSQLRIELMAKVNTVLVSKSMVNHATVTNRFDMYTSISLREISLNYENIINIIFVQIHSQKSLKDMLTKLYQHAKPCLNKTHR